MYNGEDTHWCYQCNRPIGLQGQEVICPYCHGGFVQELHEVQDSPSEDYFTPNGGGIPPALPHVLDAMHYFMMEGDMESRNRFMGFIGSMMREAVAHRNPNFAVRGRVRSLPETRHHAIPPDAFVDHPGQVPHFALTRVGQGSRSRPPDFDEYFMGPGIEELIQLLSLNDRSGPPPAPRSAIDSMPTIRITQSHLREDSQCPVCKDEFELGVEARMMPCHHIYHSDCIVPWLVQHNSCPVCRYEMPAHGTSSGHDVENWNGLNGGSGNGIGPSDGDDGRQTRGRRSRLSFLWPFNSSNSHANQFSQQGGNSSSYVHDPNHETGYSRWEFN